jgi:hypothetical protein
MGIAGMRNKFHRLLLLFLLLIFTIPAEGQEGIVSSDSISSTGVIDSVAIFKAQIAGFDEYLQHSIGISPVAGGPLSRFGMMPLAIDGMPFSPWNAIKAAKDHSPRSLGKMRTANMLMLSGLTVFIAGTVYLLAPVFLPSENEEFSFDMTPLYIYAGTTAIGIAGGVSGSFFLYRGLKMYDEDLKKEYGVAAKISVEVKVE